MKKTRIIFPFFLFFLCFQMWSFSASPSFRIIGYYAGQTIPVDSFETGKLTHLIYCFAHLSDGKIALGNSTDSVILKRMVELKKSRPELKVMISLGGWGGCASCSDDFSTEKGRRLFAHSVKQLMDYFHLDGIDLDWEYPVVKGFPGHTYAPSDRDNFTALVRLLRKELGKTSEFSFAAGGFTAYIDSSIDWQAITPVVDFINIMSYDLVHGYSTVSGHHTPLYSTPQQVESTDHAVRMLLKQKVPSEKLVIGSAFYGRFFAIEKGYPAELYQPCRFLHAFSYKYAADSLSEKDGFTLHFDTVAMAPFAVNQKRHLIATYDDDRSVMEKMKYAKQMNLGGMMFWQLYDDKFHRGLLDVIWQNRP